MLKSNKNINLYNFSVKLKNIFTPTPTDKQTPHIHKRTPNKHTKIYNKNNLIIIIKLLHCAKIQQKQQQKYDK